MWPPTVAMRMAWRISSWLSSAPPRYFSISVSSWATAASITSCRAFSTASLNSAGTSTTAKVFPSVSSSKMYCLRSMTSMWPVKSSPEPTGSWIGKALRESRERIISRQRSKFAPTRSILVREDQPGDAVAVRLAPDRLGLRLDAGDRVEQRDRAVEHAQRALDFHREVHVARRIDDVDPVLDVVAGPETGGGGGGDRDAALLLLLHPVHGGGAIMDLTDLVALPRVIEDSLGGSRLPGIDVGHDADVAIVIERGGPSHIYDSSLESGRYAVNKKSAGPGAPEGAGIHPLPPGASATVARMGTQGRAATSRPRRSFVPHQPSNCAGAG